MTNAVNDFFCVQISKYKLYYRGVSVGGGWNQEPFSLCKMGYLRRPYRREGLRPYVPWAAPLGTYKQGLWGQEWGSAHGTAWMAQKCPIHVHCAWRKEIELCWRQRAEARGPFPWTLPSQYWPRTPFLPALWGNVPPQPRTVNLLSLFNHLIQNAVI